MSVCSPARACRQPPAASSAAAATAGCPLPPGEKLSPPRPGTTWPPATHAGPPTPGLVLERHSRTRPAFVAGRSRDDSRPHRQQRDREPQPPFLRCRRGISLAAPFARSHSPATTASTPELLAVTHPTATGTAELSEARGGALTGVAQTEPTPPSGDHSRCGEAVVHPPARRLGGRRNGRPIKTSGKRPREGSCAGFVRQSCPSHTSYRQAGTTLWALSFRQAG